MFDKPATCQKVWNRLLSGFVMDALESKSDETQASAAEVQEMLGTANGMSWVKAEPVGEGEEYWADSGAEVHASALTFHESPVHLSLVMAGQGLDRTALDFGSRRLFVAATAYLLKPLQATGQGGKGGKTFHAENNRHPQISQRRHFGLGDKEGR